MKKVFTGQAYNCITLFLYIDGKDYVVQIKNGTPSTYTVIVPDEDKWIFEIINERKRRVDVIYTDEEVISEKLLRIMLKTQIDLLNVVIYSIAASTEKRVRNEVAHTLNKLLNP